MIFKYTDLFIRALDGSMIKHHGQRLFFVYALEELEAELSVKPTHFLNNMTSGGKGIVLQLKTSGKARLVRGVNSEGQQRYMIQFLNSPRYVFLSVANWNPNYVDERVTRELNFLAVTELSNMVLSQIQQDNQNLGLGEIGSQSKAAH